MGKFGKDSEKGSVLVMAVVLSFAMFILGLGFLSTVDHLENSISEDVRWAQTTYALGYGTQLMNTIVKTGGNYPGRYGEWNELIEDRAWYRSFVGFTGGLIKDENFYGSARGYVVYTQAKGDFYGARNEIFRTSKTFEILETFADYLYLTHCEEDPFRNEHIYFWTPDTLDGKVHSNDTLFIQSGHRPRFMKRVTSCAPLVMPPNNQATFDEGFFPNSDSVYFPDQADEIRIRSYKHNFGTFDPDSVTELTFDGNRIYVRYCGPEFVDPDTVLNCFPDYIAQAPAFTVPPAVGALFVHGKLFIKASRGYLDLMDGYFPSSGFEGRLTVACSDTMVIYDNLIYKNADPDNSVPTNINDCLGLISETCIMIGDSVRDTVYINAALAAINGTISVRDIYDYGTYGNPNNNEKQSLFIYGSLAMRNRGLVHTSYNGWGVRGFIEKDYHYDTRLQLDPPPYFIRTRQYNVVYWEDNEG